LEEWVGGIGGNAAVGELIVKHVKKD